MFEGGKGVYAEGFGTLDEHRVSFEQESSDEPGLHFEFDKQTKPEAFESLGQIAETHLQTSAELQNQSAAISKELENILQALQVPPASGYLLLAGFFVCSYFVFSDEFCTSRLIHVFRISSIFSPSRAVLVCFSHIQLQFPGLLQQCTHDCWTRASSSCTGGILSCAPSALWSSEPVAAGPAGSGWNDSNGRPSNGKSQSFCRATLIASITGVTSDGNFVVMFFFLGEVFC